MNKLLSVISIVAVGALASNALAAGGTSGSSSSAPAVTAAKPKPKLPPKATAMVKKVKPASTELTDDWAKTFGDLGPAYLGAVKLAKADKYDAAIKAMQALNKPDDPRVNNWIGYSLRKMGKVAEAMPYYDKALKAAPNFTPAHEYLGEAYVQMKDSAKAKDQLAQIEKLCGNKTCEEYMDLSKALTKAAL